MAWKIDFISTVTILFLILLEMWFRYPRFDWIYD